MLKIKTLLSALTIAAISVVSLSGCNPKADPDQIEVAKVYMTFANDILAVPADEAAYTLSILEHTDVTEFEDKRKKHLIQSSKMTAWDTFDIIQPETHTFEDEKELLIEVLRVRSYITAYNVKVYVPADAVTIKNNKATIDRENFYVIYDDFGGVQHPYYSKSALAAMPDIEMVKIDGEWVIPSTRHLLLEIVY